MDLYDGFIACFGVDGSTNPSMLKSGMMSSAVNRTFRGFRNRTRPPFKEIAISFSDDATEQIFKRGAVQSAIGYRAAIGNPKAKIVVAVGGRLISLEISGNVGYAKTIYNKLNPSFMNGWFVQVEDRIYFQDGLNRPLGWDGVGEVYELPDEPESMPTGTAMAYTQGRLAVTTPDNHVIISDHIYGNQLTNTRGVETFKEYAQYNDIGVFGTPSNLGPITGITPVTQPGTVNAQGPLLVMCSNGAYTISTSSPRSQWLTSGVQLTVLTGRGGAGDKAITNVNNDVWFLSSDGVITSYAFEHQYRSSESATASISLEVDQYMSLTSDFMMPYASMIVSDNRLLTTTAIQRSPSTEGGFHRYGLGMVALDLYAGPTDQQKASMLWDGLWTGIQPCELINLYADKHQRSFAISFDGDENRIYEICRSGYDDEIGGKRVKIKSSFSTGGLLIQRNFNERPIDKSATAVSMSISGCVNKCTVGADIKPIYYPMWTKAMEDRTIGSDRRPIELGILKMNASPQYAGIRGDTIQSDAREMASYRLIKRSSGFQVRVNCVGSMFVERLQLQAETIPDTTSAADAEIDDNADELITGSVENLFDYQISKS